MPTKKLSERHSKTTLPSPESALLAAQNAARFIPTPSSPAPLFSIPLPVIGLTGPMDSGKTMAAVLLDPEHTLYLDTEQSATTYARQYGIAKHIDVPGAIVAGGKKATPEQIYLWILDHITKTKQGTYRVCVIDTVEIVEQGIRDMISENPKKYRLPTDDLSKINQLFWAAFRSIWKSVLPDILARFEVFIFATHEKAEYAKGSRVATGKMVPSCDDMLLKMASVVFSLSRPYSVKLGGPIDKPIAKIATKARLSMPWADPVTGEIKPRRVCPPLIKEFTFGKLRWYMMNPPDFDNLSEDERVPEDTLTEDERLRLKAQTAADLAEAARLQAEHDAKTEKWVQQNRDTQAIHPSPRDTPPEAEVNEEEEEGQGPVTSDLVSAKPQANPDPKELDLLEDLRRQAFENGLTKPVYQKIAAKCGMDLKTHTVSDYKRGEVRKLVHLLASQLDLMSMHDALYGSEDLWEDRKPKSKSASSEEE